MHTRKDIEELEEKTLAPYAMKSRDSAGRFHQEPDHETRTCYQRDRDRIVHCEAFRNLEYKTQVFIILEGDYYRTRLTHTIEVAQLARTIGRNLGLNEDLIEAIALAHDLGHPPFGHAGEEALNEIMARVKKTFNHNKRSFDVVTKFEHRYPDFSGLNLSIEVLVGILKHSTAYDLPTHEIPADMFGRLKEHPTLEAQVVDIADSLAYLNHDIDDGLTSGCIKEEDLVESSLWNKALRKIQKTLKHDDKEMLKYQIVKQLIDMQAKDLLANSSKKIQEAGIKSSSEAKKSSKKIISFSQEMEEERNSLQNLLNKKLYHHYRVEKMTSKAKRIIRDLFQEYESNPRQLPPAIYNVDKKYSEEEKFEMICQYLAQMTDRRALDEYKKFFSPYEKV